MHIRPVSAADAPALAAICLRTGLAGDDATGAFGDDSFLGDVYALPYVFGPACAGFVLDGSEGVVGYILGSADTRAFQQWFSEEWWTGERAARTQRTDQDAWLLAAAADPSRMLNPSVDNYPAHLHVDIVADYQRRGWGRALLDIFLDELARRAVPGVHLEAAVRNQGAQRFYARVGFQELARTDQVVRWGWQLASTP